jgi:hypothetical protein
MTPLPGLFRRRHSAIAHHLLGERDSRFLRRRLTVDRRGVPPFSVLNAPRLALVGPLDRAPADTVDAQFTDALALKHDIDARLAPRVGSHGAMPPQQANRMRTSPPRGCRRCARKRARAGRDTRANCANCACDVDAEVPIL